MKLDHNDRLIIEQLINAFIATGDNDYYQFSRNELRTIILNNPSQIILIDPDGKIFTYNLKPSEHHYVGFLKHHQFLINEKNIRLPKSDNYLKLNFIGKDSDKNASANEICRYLLKNNYIVIQSWYRISTLKKYYAIPLHKNPTTVQSESLSFVMNELNLDDTHKEKADEYGDFYSIEFEYQQKKIIKK